MQKEFIEIVKQFILTMSKFLEKLEVRTADDFKEADHPRDKDGKFAKINGSKNNKNENQSSKENKEKDEENSNNSKQMPNDIDKINSDIVELAKENSSQICAYLDGEGIEKIPVTQLPKKLTDKEISFKVGRRDTTKGSCVSLALAYIGNKLGLDCMDFRGGKSLSFFKKRASTILITGLANGQVDMDKDDFKVASRLLKTLEQGKEYYFWTAQHASIVRKNDDNIEYLELQDYKKLNGFRQLSNKILKERFGCKENDETVYSGLFDIENLKNNKDFYEILGYINTNQKRRNWK